MQISSPLRLRIDSGRGSQEICWSNQIFRSPSEHARFLFLVKQIFFVIKKIKFIFFLSILKRVSTLKPAGEDEDNVRVNKL